MYCPDIRLETQDNRLKPQSDWLVTQLRQELSASQMDVIVRLN